MFCAFFRRGRGCINRFHILEVSYHSFKHSYLEMSLGILIRLIFFQGLDFKVLVNGVYLLLKPIFGNFVKGVFLVRARTDGECVATPPTPSSRASTASPASPVLRQAIVSQIRASLTRLGAQMSTVLPSV